jgi:hypothetical protein
VVKDGRPVEEMGPILELVAQHHLVLATGHSAAAESLVLIAAAKKRGIENLVVTHALSVPGGATDEQLRQMVQMGAVIEMTWLATLPAAQPTTAGAPNAGTGATAGAASATRSARPITAREYVRVIHMLGAEHVLISSDMGQLQRPTHVQAMRAFLMALKAEGLTDGEIDWVARQNAARVLGLDG